MSVKRRKVKSEKEKEKKEIMNEQLGLGGRITSSHVLD
jgi:hypothetical protein